MEKDNKYFHYYNNNIKNKETDDCVYRALSLFLNKPWEEIARISMDYYKKTGVSIIAPYIPGEREKNEMPFLEEEYGCEKFDRNVNPFTTIKDFIDKYAKEDTIYFVSADNHVSVIKGKQIWDTWDCSNYESVVIYKKKSA